MLPIFRSKLNYQELVNERLDTADYHILIMKSGSQIHENSITKSLDGGRVGLISAHGLILIVGQKPSGKIELLFRYPKLSSH